MDAEKVERKDFKTSPCPTNHTSPHRGQSQLPQGPRPSQQPGVAGASQRPKRNVPAPRTYAEPAYHSDDDDDKALKFFTRKASETFGPVQPLGSTLNSKLCVSDTKSRVEQIIDNVDFSASTSTKRGALDAIDTDVDLSTLHQSKRQRSVESFVPEDCSSAFSHEDNGPFPTERMPSDDVLPGRVAYRKALPTVETPGADCPSDTDDEFGGFEDEEASPEVATVSAALVQSARIALKPSPNGLIVLKPTIRANYASAIQTTISQQEGYSRVSSGVWANVLHKDVPILGLQQTDDELKAYAQALTTHLQSFFAQDNNEYFCDYTGAHLHWSPAGSPRAMSVEAVYPYGRYQDTISYHLVPNVYMVSVSLNRTKGLRPAVSLPLVASWMRIVDRCSASVLLELDSLRWCFNALMNDCLLMRAALCTAANASHRFEAWRTWDQSKQQVVLEALRTGRRIDDVDSFQAHPFPVAHRITSAAVLTPYTSAAFCKEVLATLLRIALHHGLTEAEFLYYCTVQSADVSAKPVFFPFHVLSKPTAREVGWSWRDIAAFCERCLLHMRRKCNSAAEALGLGEPQLTSAHVMYLWMHDLAVRIQCLKQQHPDCDQRSLALLLLDRWGLPLMPWHGHVFTAAMCKLQCHGIAMKTGFIFPTDTNTIFDPVIHYDSSKRTITFDTRFTNTMMFDYDPALWQDLRSLVKLVPLQHPLWRVDEKMGDSIWLLGSRVTSDFDAAPVAPDGTFDVNVPLLDISSWSHGVPLAGSLHCCGETFKGLGFYIRHLWTFHSVVPYECDTCGERFGNFFDMQAHSLRHEAQQIDTVDYHEDDAGRGHMEWVNASMDTYAGTDPSSGQRNNTVDSHAGSGETTVLCPLCDEIHSSWQVLGRHLLHRCPVVRPFACQEATCSARFTKQEHLQKHLDLSHDSDREYLCPLDDCGSPFIHVRSLHMHLAGTHELEPFPCPVLGCTEGAQTPDEIVGHIRLAHPGSMLSCSYQGCCEKFDEPVVRKYHEQIVHEGKTQVCLFRHIDCYAAFDTLDHLLGHERRHAGRFSCPAEGCLRVFAGRFELNNHYSREHEQEEHPCQTCGTVFNTAMGLRQHRRQVHNAVAIWICRRGTCVDEFASETSRDNHERMVHDGKAFTCGTCGKKHASQTNLNAHILTHTQEKVWKCKHEGCEAEYRSYLSLVRHRNVEHLNLKFYCKYCPKSYDTSAARQTHERRTHKTQEEYVCQYCGKSYVKAVVLSNHIKAKHADGQLLDDTVD